MTWRRAGFLHVIAYHKDTQKVCEHGRRLGRTLSDEKKLSPCQKYAVVKGGTAHGWRDAFNPQYNWRDRIHRHSIGEEIRYSDVSIMDCSWVWTVPKMLRSYMRAFFLKPCNPFYQPHDAELRKFVRSFRVNRIRKAVAKLTGKSSPGVWD